MAKNIRLIRPRVVTGDGVGLVSHAGIGWLAETADLSGLTAGLTAAMTRLRQRRHDPGRTLAHMVLAIADGATCLSDLAGLRAQPAMFGPVASDPTVWRTFDQIGPHELRQITAARAAARARVWAAGAGPAGDRLIIDFDATLLPTRSNKQDAAPTYKRTFGHHPLLAMIVETDEVLTGLMRAGNAGSNTAEAGSGELCAPSALSSHAHNSGCAIGDRFMPTRGVGAGRDGRYRAAVTRGREPANPLHSRPDAVRPVSTGRDWPAPVFQAPGISSTVWQGSVSGLR